MFSPQLVLGENLDLDRIEAAYRDGLLRLHIPVAGWAKPRKIAIDRDLTHGHNGNGDTQQPAHDTHRRRTVTA